MLLILAGSAAAGGFATCSMTEASAASHGSWRVYAEPGEGAVEDADDGFASAHVKLATAFGDTAVADLCPADDPMRGVDLPLRRLGMIALDISETEIGSACPSTSWARGEGVVEGAAEIEQRGIGASVRARSSMEVAADNAAGILVDSGAGSRFAGAWHWRASGAARTRISGTVTVELEPNGGGGRLSVPGWALVDAWDGRVDAWVRRGDGYEHVTGAAPMTIEVWAVMPAKSGSICGGGTASFGGFASETDIRIEGATALSFALEAEPTDEPANLVPRGDFPMFDLCSCQ